MRFNFIGVVGMNRVMCFMIDSYDERNDDDFYELVGDDDGVFGCMSFIVCYDICFKELFL